MSIHVALHHVTHYRYDRRVSLGPQIVRLRPAPHSRTRVLSYSLRVTPQDHFINWQQDPQSNYLARLVFPEKTTQLRIEVDLVAEQTATGMFELWLKPAAEGELARVELAWRDLAGQPRRIERVIARKQVASTFATSPPWLQQGIVAASAAELLRGSYYVPRSRRLGQLQELVGEVNESAAKAPEFQALVRLIETADGLR